MYEDKLDTKTVEDKINKFENLIVESYSIFLREELNQTKKFVEAKEFFQENVSIDARLYNFLVNFIEAQQKFNFVQLMIPREEVGMIS